MVTVDVRELSMPMPMMMILGKLDDLPEGHALFAHHKRIPSSCCPSWKKGVSNIESGRGPFSWRRPPSRSV